MANSKSTNNALLRSASQKIEEQKAKNELNRYRTYGTDNAYDQLSEMMARNRMKAAETPAASSVSSGINMDSITSQMADNQLRKAARNEKVNYGINLSENTGADQASSFFRNNMKNKTYGTRREESYIAPETADADTAFSSLNGMLDNVISKVKGDRNASSSQEKNQEMAEQLARSIERKKEQGNQKKEVNVSNTGNIPEASLNSAQYLNEGGKGKNSYTEIKNQYAVEPEFQRKLDASKKVENAINMQNAVENARDFAEEHPFAGVGMNLASDAVGSVITPIAAAQQKIKGEKEYDQNSNAFKYTNISDAYREGIKKAAGADDGTTEGFVKSFLIDTGLSMVQSTVRAATLTPLAGAVQAGLGAGSSAFVEAKKNGASDSQALMQGAAQGIAEELFEKLSLENLDAFSGKPVDTIKTAVMNVLKQAVTEGSEEAFTEIANAVTDALIMGNQSQWQKWREEAIRGGASAKEANMYAISKLKDQVLLSALGGAISGAGMGGSVEALQSGMQLNAARGSQLGATGDNSYGKVARNVVTDPMAYRDASGNVYTDVSQLATDIKDRADSYAKRSIGGKPVNNLEKGYLQMQIDSLNKATANLKNDKLNPIRLNLLPVSTNENEEGFTVKDSNDQWEQVLSRPDFSEAEITDGTTTYNVVRDGDTIKVEKNQLGSDPVVQEFNINDIGNGGDTDIVSFMPMQSADQNAPKLDANVRFDARNATDEAVETYRTKVAEKAAKNNQSQFADYTKENSVRLNTARSMNTMVNMYNGRVDKQRYLNAYKQAYVAGYNGMSVDRLQNMPTVNAFLTNEQKMQAFRDGMTDSNLKAQIKPVYVNGEARKGGVTVGSEKLSNTQNKVLNWVGNKTGLRIEVVEGLKGNAEINVDAGVMRINPYTKNFLGSVSHELTHLIRQFSPEEYNTLQKLTVEALMNSKNADYNTIFRQYETAYKAEHADYTVDDVLEEMTADGATAFLNDPVFAEKLAREDKGLAKKIADFYKGIADSLKQLIDDKGIRNVGKVLRENEKLYRQAADTWYAALEKASERYASGQKVDQEYAKKRLTELGFDVLEGNTVTRESLDTWNEFVQDEEKKQELISMLSTLGYTKKEINKWFRDIDSIASQIAEEKVRLDYEAEPDMVMLKPNNEYVVTLDASTLCAKRLLYQGTYNAIQHLMPNHAITPDETIEIRQILKEKGYESPCGICYVESRRKNLGKFAKRWLNRYDGEYKPALDEVTTTDGLAKLKAEHRQTYEDFISGMNHTGVANPKVVQTRTEYRRDLMNLTKSQINKIVRLGGLRVQSFSDFETPHLIDMMQAVMDMSSLGLTSQAYTKVPAFAWVFGDTGIKINLSLIGDLDENGKLRFDNVEGMDINEALKIRKKYSKNVGTILVGKNKEHVLAAMADNRIDFIIPFHRSGWGKNQFAALGLSGYDASMAAQQNERDINTKKTVSNLYPADYWDFSKTGKENAQIYLQKCAEMGRIPKFNDFLMDNGDGTWSLQEDGSTDGYWKLLIDYKMYDNNGIGAPQRMVSPVFNMKEANRVLSEYEGGANTLKSADDVVQEFAKRIEERKTKNKERKKKSNRYSGENATESEIIAFVQNVLGGTNTQRDILILNKISKNIADEIEKIVGFDVTGYKMILDKEEVIHINKGHGAKGSTDHSMADIGEYKYLSKLNDSDAIGRPGKKAVKKYRNKDQSFSKTVELEFKKGDGSYYVVEAVTDTDYKEMHVISIYQTKNAVSQEINTNTSPDPYVQNVIVPTAISSVAVDESNGNENLRHQLEIDDNLDTDADNMVLDSSRELRESTETLGQLLSATHYMPSDEMIIATAKKLKKDTGTDTDIEKITEDLKSFYNFIAYNSKIDGRDMSKIAADYVGDLLSNSTKVTYDQKEVERYRGIKNVLKKYTFHMPEGYKGELDALGGVAGLRREFFGTLNITKEKGLALDEIYSELADALPEYLDRNNMNPANQLEDIVTVLRLNKPKASIGWSNQNDFDAARYFIGQDIFRAYSLQGIADIGGRAVYNELNTKENDILQAKATEMQARYMDELQKAKQMVSKQTMRDRVYEARKSSKSRYHKDQIMKDARELSNWLLKPTDKKHVPEVLRQPLANFLSQLDFTSSNLGLDGEPTQRSLYWMQLKDTWMKIANNGGMAQGDDGSQQYMIIDTDVLSKMSELTDKIKDIKKLEDLEYLDLVKLNDIMKSMKHSIQTANEMISLNRSVTDVADGTLNYLSDLNTKKKYSGAVGTFRDMMQNKMLDATTRFHTFGKDANDVYQAVRKGFNKKVQHTAQAATMFDQIKNRVGVDDREINRWSKSESMLHYTTERGEKLDITVAQLMNLYNLMKREQSRDHIHNGGIVLTTTKMTDNWKDRLTGRISDQEKMLLTMKDTAMLVNMLTDQQKRFADELMYTMQEFAKWGNETSMELMGYKKFMDPHYWPIKSSRDYLSMDLDQAAAGGVVGVAVKNAGPTKSIVKHANNPITVGDVIDVWSDHVNFMANYNAFTIPLTDLVKWYNYIERGQRDEETGEMVGDRYKTSIKQEIKRTFGDDADGFILRFIEDVNGMGNKDRSVVNGLISAFKGSAVGANLSVAIQQPTAVFRAMAVMDPKYLTSSVVAKSEADWNTIKRYSSMAQWKDWGFFEINTGKSMKSILTGQDTLLENLNEKQMWLAGKGDEITWKKLWTAAELQVKDQYRDLKPGTDAFYKKTAEVFDNVIDQTQVVDSVFTKSDLMRSKKEMNKMITSFFAEPTKSYNMLYRAAFDYTIADTEKKKSAAKNLLVKSTAAFLLSNMAAAMAKSIISAMRDKDDERDKAFWERWWSHAVDEFTGNVNPLNYIPWVKDAYSWIFEGYEQTRPDLQAIKDLKYVSDRWKKYFSGESNYSLGNNVLYTTKALSTFTGLAAYGLQRDVNAIIDTMIEFGGAQGLNYEKQKLLGKDIGSKSNITYYMRKAMKAYESGNTALGDKIVRDMMNAGIPEEKIELKKKDFLKEDAAMQELINAVMANDQDSIGRIREELIRSGYSDDMISGQITSGLRTSMKENNLTYDGMNIELDKITDYSTKGYADFYNMYNEWRDASKIKNGWTEKECAQNFRSQCTKYFKPLYKNGNAQERSRILNILSRLVINGERVYKESDIKKWSE